MLSHVRPLFPIHEEDDSNQSQKYYQNDESCPDWEIFPYWSRWSRIIATTFARSVTTFSTVSKLTVAIPIAIANPKTVAVWWIARNFTENLGQRSTLLLVTHLQKK